MTMIQNPTNNPSDTVSAVSWVSYMLHLVVAIAAVLPGIQASVFLLIVAFIADMVMQGDAAGSYQESHYSWRLKSVLLASALSLIRQRLTFAVWPALWPVVVVSPSPLR